mgnify:CR=1 FL=1
MTDIPAYNEKEISMKDISFVIRAIDGRKTSGGRLFCTERSGTKTIIPPAGRIASALLT